jgi:hypothetical protein
MYLHIYLDKKGHKISQHVKKKSFGNFAKFRYLETTVTSQTFVEYKINSRLNSENSYTIRSSIFYFPVFYLRM